MISEQASTVGIVGGGPAGCFLAYNLARAGCDVTLFDPKAPWEKPCGGGLNSEALSLFPLLQDYPYAKHSLTEMRLISPDDDKTDVPLAVPLLIVSRKELNEFLLSQAVAAGARFVPERVIQVERRTPGWRLVTAHSAINVEVLVGADGANSLVRRTILGPWPCRHLAVCVGYHLTGYPPSDIGLIKFGPFEGYIWFFPGERFGSAGIGARLGSKRGSELVALLKDFLDTYLEGTSPISRWGALLPTVSEAAFYEQPAAGDDWLLVGDAAGHVHPITGAGLVYALWSGKLAAEAIMAARLEQYEASWRESYGLHLMEACRFVAQLELARPLFGDATFYHLFQFAMGK